MSERRFSRCLGCYEPLGDEEGYHGKCSKSLFGVPVPPKLDTSFHELQLVAEDLVSRHIAVTGVQKKLSLSLEKDDCARLTIVGSLGGEFIMKPPSSEYPSMPENEDLAMHLAAACGIKVAKHGLLPLASGELAFVTRRFDRQRKKKVALEDLCQLSELLTEQKYHQSSEKTAKVIRNFSSFPGDDVLRFFEIIVFSFLIGNNDMHLKNFSLFTEKPDGIRLTPAYDLLSVRLLITAKEDSDELALTMNGKRSKFKRKDFEQFAASLQIPEKVSQRVMQRLCTAKDTVSLWTDRSFLPNDQKEELKAIYARGINVLMA